MKSFIIMLASLLLGSEALMAQDKKPRHFYREFSVGGSYVFQSRMLVDNAFAAQGLPIVNPNLVGTQLQYRIGYKKYLLSLGYQYGVSKQVDMGFTNRSFLYNAGLTMSYALFYDKKTKLYLGLNAQSSQLQLLLRENNKVQRINSLAFDNVAMYNHQLVLGPRILAYLFDDSYFPLLVGAGYDYGTGGRWRIDGARFNNKLTENFKRLYFSIDIPIVRR